MERAGTAERFDEKAYLKATGAEFQQARLSRGMSRESLAERSGVHLNTISALERGAHDVNSTTKCWILAALGCKSLVMENLVDRIVLHDDPAAYPRSDIQSMPDSAVVRIIGQAIRERRETLDATLEDIATLADVHVNTLWNIERGLVSATGIHLHRIYRALGICVVTPEPDGIILE